jgi:hypothetical protein
MYVFVGIVAIGTVFLVVGMLVWTGRYKRWYLHEGDPLYSPKEIFYILIPIGLASLSLGLAAFLPTKPERSTAFLWVTLPLALAASLLLFFTPDWIKPAWVRWLEKNHGDMLLLLLREARRTPNWEKRVATQEGLEAWVAEVRDKYTLKPGEGAKVIKDW